MCSYVTNSLSIFGEQNLDRVFARLHEKLYENFHADFDKDLCIETTFSHHFTIIANGHCMAILHEDFYRVQ